MVFLLSIVIQFSLPSSMRALESRAKRHNIGRDDTSGEGGKEHTSTSRKSIKKCFYSPRASVESCNNVDDVNNDAEAKWNNNGK
jgi:hypothetical protein